MKVVYKYEINKMFEVIWMPEGAQILKFMVVNSMITFWAEVDTGKKSKERVFHVIPTGAEIDKELWLVYRDTIRFERTGLVYHIYEEV